MKNPIHTFESGFEIDSFVQMPHFDVTSLFFAIGISEFGQIVTGHSQQIYQFPVMSMVHEGLD